MPQNSMSIKEPTPNESELLEEHIRLVHYLVRKLNLNYEYEELVQVGTFGLLKAIRTFDDTKATFSTYASRCITNQLLMHHRRQKKHISTLSLDSELTNSKGERFDRYDILEAAASDETGAVEARIVLQEQIKQLNPKELEVLQLKLSGKNQYEIGQKLNISQSYISRIEKRALNRLSKHLEPYRGAESMGRGTGRKVCVGPRKSTEEPVLSPVTTYTLPPEELEKYRNETQSQKYKPQRKQIEIKGGLSMETKKTQLDIAREKLTQDVYLELKDQGLKDTEIIKQLEIAAGAFYKLKKEFTIGDRLSQQDKPEIVWVDKRNFGTSSNEPMVVIGRRFSINVAAKKLIMTNGVKIGVMGDSLVLAPCNSDDCYKISGSKGATIGGKGLLKGLAQLGVTAGKYLLTKDQNGYLVGCKEVIDNGT